MLPSLHVAEDIRNLNGESVEFSNQNMREFGLYHVVTDSQMIACFDAEFFF